MTTGQWIVIAIAAVLVTYEIRRVVRRDNREE